MKRHKWGISWLAQLAWNSAFFAWDVTTGSYWLAALMAILAAFSGVMAYRDLTKVSRTVTITITPDMSQWDAAMKRAMRTKP